MPQVWVTIDGLKEVIDEFTKLPEKGINAMSGAVNKGLDFLEPKIRAAIPVDDTTDDDEHLRDNLKIRKAKGKNVKQGGDVYTKGSKNSDYGFHLEAGHATKKGRRIKARPFMRETTDKCAEDIANLVVDSILDGMGV